jgi:MoaA/NifB/PqqE/SkfB family radical SAM enzyme
MRYDPELISYFNGRVRQIFLYVTDRCGLRCEQCLYKTTLAHREMEHDVALAFTEDFRRLGAEKLTLIGGEPMLYGLRERRRPLIELIELARSVGYRYVRMDTNGQQGHALLAGDGLRGLTNIAVSIDGHTADINDVIRGEGSFEKASRFARESAAAGHYTTVTTCVHPGNIDHLDDMVEYATALGASELNFHPLFKMGIERDLFSGETDIAPERWVREYARLRAAVDGGRYPIHVRAPRRFVATAAYLASPEQYEYCPSLMGERILIHPNGEMRICALCIGTPITVARYKNGHVVFDGPESELSEERRRRRPCMSQTRDFGALTPLCISYKPFQNEYVWTRDSVDGRLFGAAGA